MKDITHELDQIQRGLLACNSQHGIFRGGSMDGQKFGRRWNSATMKNNQYPDELYVRTGEIEVDEREAHHVVYRIKP